MIKTVLAACALLCAFTIASEARPRLAHPDCNITMPCEGVAPSARGEKISRQLGFGGAQKIYTPRAAVRTSGTVVGGRPAGCPHRYCGCGISLDVFNRIIPALNLAANWIDMFQRTSPSPGMVAARRGHVMRLRQHVAGNTWLVFDPNSGRGLTRIHQRSIAGYVIVNPHAARYASVQ